jgi:hypothetical protein
MTREHSSKEEENCGARAEETAVPSARVVPAEYDSALSQLNSLVAPDGAGRSIHPGNGATETASESAAPAHDDSALDLLKALCALGEEKAPRTASVTEQSLGDSTNCDGLAEKSETVSTENGSAPTPLNAPGVVADSEYPGSDIVSVEPATADYHVALLQIIESAARDPCELRKIVYELARTSLAREPGQGGLTPDPHEMVALETAIARVEATLSWRQHSDMRLSGFGTGLEHFDDGLVRDKKLPETMSWLIVRNRASDRAVESMVPLGSDKASGGSARTARAPFEIVYPEQDKTDTNRVQRRAWLWFILWPLIQLVGPAAFCLALYVALAGRLDRQGTQTRQAIVAEAQQSRPVEGVKSSGLPLPSTYGVYAVSNGNLKELQPLPIRAPDPRIQLSAEIRQPSSSVLPDGRIAFVVFQRELLNRAPEKVAVRIVARVSSALTFSAGKAAAVKPDASWHIRSNSYNFQVSPLNENREMIVARPGDPDFALPSGRYALVFDGLAYDFTVDGPVTEPAQCLESFEAVNGPVFTECHP